MGLARLLFLAAAAMFAAAAVDAQPPQRTVGGLLSGNADTGPLAGSPPTWC